MKNSVEKLVNDFHVEVGKCIKNWSRGAQVSAMYVFLWEFDRELAGSLKKIPFSVPKHFWELASYVSLNFVYLICRKRDFPVKAKTFSDFQYFLTYARPFNGIFSYSKIEIPGIYMFKVDKNCLRGAYFTEFLMFLLLTLNIIFISDIYILYVNVRWEYSALQQKSLCFYSSLLGYSKK